MNKVEYIRLEALTVDSCNQHAGGVLGGAIGDGNKMTREIGAFGRLVRRARHDSGLTLRELAILIGVSHAYVSILEVGRRRKSSRPSRPSPDIIRSMARELGLDANKLLTLTEHTSIDSMN